VPHAYCPPPVLPAEPSAERMTPVTKPFVGISRWLAVFPIAAFLCACVRPSSSWSFPAIIAGTANRSRASRGSSRGSRTGFGPVRSLAPSSRLNRGGERIFGNCVRRARPGQRKWKRSSEDLEMQRANSMACLRISDHGSLRRNRKAMHNVLRQVSWFVRRDNEFYACCQIAVV
jgi:hypothetical protein